MFDDIDLDDNADIMGNPDELGSDTFFFPGYKEDTRKTLIKITFILANLSAWFIAIKRIALIVAIILNFFHICVLTRKLMRNNSINAILTFLAFYDIILMVMSFRTLIPEEEDASASVLCSPSEEVYSSLSLMILDLVRRYFRRSSAWLIILMALIRMLLIKNYDKPQYERFGTFKFGLIAALFNLVFSCLFSLPAFIPFYKNGIYKTVEWDPLEICDEYTDGSTKFQEVLTYSIRDYERNDIIDGVTINLIPSVLYPILTIILHIELQKAKKRILLLGKEKEKDHTTKIVKWMVISFMIAEVPQTIANFFLRTFLNTPGFALIADNVEICFSIMTVINSATHCVICFTLASNYRKTVFSILRLKRSNKTSLGPIQSTHILHSITGNQSDQK